MDVVKGILTVLLLPIGTAATIGIIGSFYPSVGSRAIATVVVLIVVLYALEAAILGAYDLFDRGTGWLALLVDGTWSLPNTLFGGVVGNLLYVFFGSPSRADSRDQNWVVFTPRGAFGSTVKQTLGPVNLGGAGQHERMHLLQARLLGPLYLPLFGINYVVNTLLQVAFTATLGLALWACKVIPTPYVRPSSQSVVQGFFGAIYYYTLFELWAYSSGNP